MDDGYETLMASIEAGRAQVELLSLDELAGRQGLTLHDLHDVAVMVRYTNDRGETSDRWVTIHEVTADVPPKLKAFCWARRSIRLLRADRVESVCDETGEVWSGADFFAAFGVSMTEKPRPARRRKASAPKANAAPNREIPEWKKHLNDHLQDPRPQPAPPAPVDVPLKEPPGCVVAFVMMMILAVLLLAGYGLMKMIAG